VVRFAIGTTAQVFLDVVGGDGLGTDAIQVEGRQSQSRMQHAMQSRRSLSVSVVETLLRFSASVVMPWQRLP
jgi:hypothetical protein